MSSNSLAIVPQYQDPQMLETIKETVCRGATPAQFKMFIEVCKATGLNPFLKEIWFVPSVGVMAGRDGYLRVANASPQFDGMETRVERTEQGVPIKAVCTVWRKDRAHPVICEAYYNEYKKGGNVWNTYPSAMIAKVAEVLALKRSFAINGVVTEEEVGEQGSKEAQQEYLRSKGIHPKDAGTQPSAYTQDVRTASDAHKALIVETAKMLDEPPQVTGLEPYVNTKTIEMRHAATVAEADAVLTEVRKPKKGKTGFVSFEVLKHFGLIKQEMRDSFGDDTAYYTVLKGFGYDHANAISDDNHARGIYKVLATERNRLKQEKELLGLLEHGSEVLGARVFADLLGTYGAETIPDVLNMAADPLAELLKALKACVDEKNAGGAA